MEQIDQKFMFTAVNPDTGRIVTQHNGMVFKASDDAVPAMLDFYLAKCMESGCGEAQLEGVRGLILRTMDWREENPEQCKPADMNAREAKRILGGEDTPAQQPGNIGGAPEDDGGINSAPEEKAGSADDPASEDPDKLAPA